MALRFGRARLSIWVAPLPRQKQVSGCVAALGVVAFIFGLNTAAAENGQVIWIHLGFNLNGNQSPEGIRLFKSGHSIMIGNDIASNYRGGEMKYTTITVPDSGGSGCRNWFGQSTIRGKICAQSKKISANQYRLSTKTTFMSSPCNSINCETTTSLALTLTLDDDSCKASDVAIVYQGQSMAVNFNHCGKKQL
jgi:hypothetical protein